MTNPIENLAVRFGSDKRYDIHGYTEHYWTYFRDIKPKSLLEIGVFGGASVNMWQAYWPSSKIVGVDSNIDTLDIKTINPKIELHIGDQADPEFLKTLGTYDIIIDDGGHTMNQQITSFEFLWNRLNKGGLYVIEDLHTSYWPEFQDYEFQGKPFKTTDFLKMLVDSVNLNGVNGYGNIFSKGSREDKEGYGFDKLEKAVKANEIFYNNIYFVHLYKSIVFIKKRG